MRPFQLSGGPTARRLPPVSRVFEAFLNRILPVDSDTALGAATLQASLEDAGTSLDPIDLLVAATARQHGATLVTANENDVDERPVHELIAVDLVNVA